MNKEIQVTELSALHDARQSFYGKAKVYTKTNGDLMLYSFDTPVAYIKANDGSIFIAEDLEAWWSGTTGRHIAEFNIQFGDGRKLSKADLRKLPTM